MYSSILLYCASLYVNVLVLVFSSRSITDGEIIITEFATGTCNSAIKTFFFFPLHLFRNNNKGHNCSSLIFRRNSKVLVCKSYCFNEEQPKSISVANESHILMNENNFRIHGESLHE